MPLPAPCNTANSAAAGAPAISSDATPSGWPSAANLAASSGCTRRRKPNSSSRPATCAGPTSAPTATAVASGAPAACNKVGRCEAIAVLTNQVTANTDASTAVVKTGRGRLSAAGAGVDSAPASALSMPGSPCTVGPGSASEALFGSEAFSGKPSTRCSPAHAKHAPRQPICASSSVDSGQPTVLAKPAISVMPVIALRDSLP